MSGLDNYFAYLIQNGLSGQDAPPGAMPAPSAGTDAPEEPPPEAGIIDLLRRRSIISPYSPFATMSPEELQQLPQGIRPPAEPEEAPSLPPPPPPGSTTTPPPGPPVPIVPPQPGAPSSAIAMGAPSIPAGATRAPGFDSNALLRFLAQDMMTNRRNDIYDKMLEFGLATMAAAGKPGSTTLGAIGEGGLQALKSGREREASGMKNILEGAQIANVLSEAGVREGQITSRDAYLEALRRGMQGGPGGTPVTDGAGVMGKNQGIIYNWLVQNGHTPVQAAGAIGWGTGESGTRDANTGITNPESGAYAWQQWLGPRKDALQQFAKENKMEVTDPVLQAMFFDHEMRTGQGAGARAKQAYWGAQTPEEVTAAMAHFSRTDGYTPDAPDMSKGYAQRLANTKAIVNRVAQTGGSGGSGGEPAQPPPGAGGESVGTAEKPPPILTQGGKVNVAYARWMAAMADAAGFKSDAAYWNKVATAPEGYTWTRDGGVVPIAGFVEGKAAVAGAEAGARVPAEITVAREKSALDTKREERLARLRSKLDTDRELTVADRKHEHDILKDNNLQEQIQLREEAIEKLKRNLEPMVMKEGETRVYRADSDQAQTMRRIVQGGGALPDGVRLDSAGQAYVTGPQGAMYANKMTEYLTKEFGEKRLEAKGAERELKSSILGQRILDEGVFSGPLYQWQTRMGEALWKAGIGSGATAANTRSYLMQRAYATAEMLKSGAFGSAQSITDKDRDYVERIQKGDLSVGEVGIRRMFEISNMIAREKLDNYNIEAEKFQPYTQMPLRIDIPGTGTAGGYRYGRQ